MKVLVLALVVSLVGVSAAVAKDHPGNKGKKPPTTGAKCKPAVTVMLSGVLGADVDPADGDTSFVMIVKQSNKHGKTYKTAGSATVMVDAKTRIRRQGADNLGALAPNDRVHVTAKVCKADLKNGGAPDLTARKIGAHQAAAPSS
ncbi:MAG TPA: hypothetical protein VHQ98_02875 [Gaiellaceae bacterium]|nr:hypothetical protein [Gaiellaceae bacterium]